jgi:alkylhydroperoxidase family enzyme
MAVLPNPYDRLDADDRALFNHMAAVRAHADGRAELGEVYVRMFNNPGVVRVVGAFGEHLRFHGVLPDRLRELAILRFSQQTRWGYEWSHHVRPASLAGISDDVIAELGSGAVPESLDDVERAVVEAIDAVAAKSSIPDAVQQVVVDALGDAAAVELVAICGLYSTMGYMVTAFDIPVETGLPPAPWTTA